jgi:hypothetical protein
LRAWSARSSAASINRLAWVAPLRRWQGKLMKLFDDRHSRYLPPDLADRHATPSGVDRVEMAYARGLLARYGDALAFAAVHPLGGYGRVPRAAALAYLDELERRWASHEDAPARRSLLSVLPQLLALWPTRKGIGRGSGRGCHLCSGLAPSPDQGALVRRILARENARFLCLVHDLIPIEFPEYARPSGAALHRLRMEAVASACAASGAPSSAATGRALAPWLTPGTPVHVALLGTEELPPAEPEPGADGRPISSVWARSSRARTTCCCSISGAIWLKLCPRTRFRVWS